MGNTVRIRNGMSNATEGDILGSIGDIVKTLGVVDLAGGHLLVTADTPTGMTVQVAGGIVYVPNSNYDELDSDTPKFYPVVCDSEVLTVENNVSGSTRIDIVCVKVDKAIAPNADADNIATKVVIKGTPGGGTPSTPANHYKLAEITVVNGETAIENSMITDTREQVVFEERYIKGLEDGWISAGETWTYASPTTFTIAGDWTGVLQKGDKIKLTQTTDKYFRITNISYSSPKTTVTIDGIYLYSLADATITNPYYSKMDNPQGFPQREVNLYSSAGTLSTITLSETAANFAFLEIFFKTSNGSFDSVKIANPNGLYANLISGNYYSSVVYVQNCVVYISGTSITFGTNTQVSLASGGVGVLTGNYIYITGVKGYRW